MSTLEDALFNEPDFSDLVNAPAVETFDTPVSLPVSPELVNEQKDPSKNIIKLVFLLPVFRNTKKNDWSCEFQICSATWYPDSTDPPEVDAQEKPEVFSIISYKNKTFDVGYVTNMIGSSCLELSQRISYLSKDCDRTLVFVGRLKDVAISVSILTGLKAVQYALSTRIKYKPISLDPRETFWHGSVEKSHDLCKQIFAAFEYESKKETKEK